jgi:hypothetical protein
MLHLFLELERCGENDGRSQNDESNDQSEKKRKREARTVNSSFLKLLSLLFIQ